MSSKFWRQRGMFLLGLSVVNMPYTKEQRDYAHTLPWLVLIFIAYLFLVRLCQGAISRYLAVLSIMMAQSTLIRFVSVLFSMWKCIFTFGAHFHHTQCSWIPLVYSCISKLWYVTFTVTLSLLLLFKHFLVLPFVPLILCLLQYKWNLVERVIELENKTKSEWDKERISLWIRLKKW